MKISILTIARNAQDTIEQTIKSVIDQDYVELEYIIIDGNSTDNTKRIIEKYRDQIAVFISEPDKGISDAFNKGIKHASGDVIGIINADDLLLQGALKTVAESFRDDTDVLYGLTRGFTETKTIPTVITESGFYGVDLERLKLKMVLSHPSVFVRRTTYERYGLFDEQYRNSMDHELMLRMYTNGAHFQSVPYVLTYFRTGGVSSTNFRRTVAESYRISRMYGTGLIPATITKIKKLLYYQFHGLIFWRNHR